MNNDSVIWGLLLFAFVAANLPFLNNRLYLVKQITNGKRKSVWMRFLELVVLFFVVGFIGRALEHKVNGQIHLQDWEFYWVAFFMFLVFALPGFIFQYTYKK